MRVFLFWQSVKKHLVVFLKEIENISFQKTNLEIPKLLFSTHNRPPIDSGKDLNCIVEYSTINRDDPSVNRLDLSPCLPKLLPLLSIGRKAVEPEVSLELFKIHFI